MTISNNLFSLTLLSFSKTKVMNIPKPVIHLFLKIIYYTLSVNLIFNLPYLYLLLKMDMIYTKEQLSPTPNYDNNLTIDVLKGLKIISQNCNSLCLSSHNFIPKIDKLRLKLNAILKQKGDIIFLQDCRLNGKFQTLKKELYLNKFGSTIFFTTVL